MRSVNWGVFRYSLSAFSPPPLYLLPTFGTGTGSDTKIYIIFAELRGYQYTAKILYILGFNSSEAATPAAKGCGNGGLHGVEPLNLYEIRGYP